MDKKVPLGFGGDWVQYWGIDLNTGGLMLVLGSREGAGVEFNPSPGTKNQEPRFPDKFSGNLGSWFLVPRGGVNSAPGTKNQEPRLPQNFSGNLGSWFFVPGEDSISPRNQDLGGD